ncbi:hypothetical protein [Devosia marina]|uniref:Uncharacterized protein n=1 Tax=Devosia marina TaxID=2683198 RepID=A0A7X3FPL7_9HYPH|nr:hypothetical protein [Devosia marina]MVS98260.1 hypothetical protein [Devosia marina]
MTRAAFAPRSGSKLNIEFDAYWRGLRDGQSVKARRRFEAARKLALDLGYVCQTSEELTDARL